MDYFKRAYWNLNNWVFTPPNSQYTVHIFIYTDSDKTDFRSYFRIF